MRRILQLLPIITLFCLIIGTAPVKSEVDSEGFYFLENKLINTGDFIENGVRVEYSSKNDVKDELLIIKNNLEELLGKDIYIKENKIIFNDKYREINVLAWKEDNETKVQINYVNNSKECTTNQIKKELQQIQYFAAKKVKYFDFVKVKIIEEQKQSLLDLLKKNIKEGTLEELNIVNGRIAKGRLINEDKINFSFMTYEDEQYLILGTPVIFITY